MNPIFRRNLFICEEHTDLFTAANNYDIRDPETGAILLTCREVRFGLPAKILRFFFTGHRRMPWFEVEVKSLDGAVVARLKRGWSPILPGKIEVLDDGGNVIGAFQQPMFSIATSFSVVGASGQPVCSLAGKWSGSEFKFASLEGREMATVTRKMGGLTDGWGLVPRYSYVLKISEEVGTSDSVRVLILSAVLTIDMTR